MGSLNKFIQRYKKFSVKFILFISFSNILFFYLIRFFTNIHFVIKCYLFFFNYCFSQSPKHSRSKPNIIPVLKEDSSSALSKFRGFDIPTYIPTYGIDIKLLVRSERIIQKFFHLKDNSELLRLEPDLKIKPCKALWRKQQKRQFLFDSAFFKNFSEDFRKTMFQIGPWSNFISYSEDSYIRSDGSYFDPYDDGYYYSKRRIPRWPIYDHHNRIVGYKEGRFGRFVYSHVDYHHLNFTPLGQNLDLSNKKGDSGIFYMASEKAFEIYKKRQEYQEAIKKQEEAELEAAQREAWVISDAEYWRTEEAKIQWWRDKKKELLPEIVYNALTKQNVLKGKGKAVSEVALKKAGEAARLLKEFLVKERGLSKEEALLAEEDFKSLTSEDLQKLLSALKDRDSDTYIPKSHEDVEKVLELKFDELGALDKSQSRIEPPTGISEQGEKEEEARKEEEFLEFKVKEDSPGAGAPFKIYKIRKGGERVSKVGTFYDSITGGYSRETPLDDRSILSRLWRFSGFLIRLPFRILKVFLQRLGRRIDNLGFRIPSRTMRFITRNVLARRVYPRLADDVTVNVPMKNFLFKTLPYRFLWGDRITGPDMLNAFFDVKNFVNSVVLSELSEDDNFFPKYFIWQVDVDALECFPIRVPDIEEYGNDRIEIYSDLLFCSIEGAERQLNFSDDRGSSVPYFWARSIPGPVAFLKYQRGDFRNQPAPNPLLCYWFGVTRPLEPRPFYSFKRWTFDEFLALDFEVRMYLTHYISSLILFCLSIFFVFPISKFWHGFLKTARHGGFRYNVTDFKMIDHKRTRTVVVNFTFWFFMITGCYFFDHIVSKMSKTGSNLAPLTTIYSWLGQTWWNKRYELFAQKCVLFRRREEEFSYNKIREHLDFQYRLRYYWKYLELGPKKRDFLERNHPLYGKCHGRPFPNPHGFFDIEEKYRLHNFVDKPTTWFERYVLLHDNRVYNYNQKRLAILEEFRTEAAEVKRNGRQMHWFRLWLYERRLYNIQKKFGPPVFSNDEDQPGIFALMYSFLYDLDLLFRYRKLEVFQTRKTGQVNPYDAYGNFVPNWVEYYPEHVNESNPIVHNRMYYYLWYDFMPYVKSFGGSPRAHLWKERHGRLRKINEDLKQAAHEINIEDIKATRIADEVNSWGEDWKGWVEDIRLTVYRRQTFEDRKEILTKELISDAEIVRNLKAYSAKSKLQSERHIKATNKKLDHLGPGTGREVPDETGARLSNKLLIAEDTVFKEEFRPPTPVVPK
jgi:hypothetical protein